MTTVQATPALFVKMAISAWDSQVKQMDKLIESFTDEQWMSEIAPGKNRGIYILGHLAAVNDYMLSLFEFSDRLHPEWEHMFIRTPDKSGHEFPSLEQLKKYWRQVNEALASNFGKMEPEAWFLKHTSVSDEIFVKEPHRNKLNVLINRTNHQSYHLGQLVLLQKLNTD
ncbi:DinB family protein [Chryseotalea sanaruensis]|uniref:DinB family protein n=1 Tax=Chryseotalea sanaruensis TaxID=2482724 RepID=A0A401U7Z1_9BACT|nr:DinB family protein [Chryseotalea sanaruensis]GCC51009.1 DinB family protein [Chryseotalea sanaruensis]